MYHWCALCNDANHVLVRQMIRVLDQYMGMDREGGGIGGGACNAAILLAQTVSVPLTASA